jgi:uncharacterized protein YdhG (YjbR/CyaY superfamily)
MNTPADVGEYLAALPEGPRATLEKLRATIKTAAPEAIEAISWGMPAFKYHGRPLVAYAAFKDHYSFFPMSTRFMEAHQKELDAYRTSKRTIRFAPGEEARQSTARRERRPQEPLSEPPPSRSDGAPSTR